MKCVRAWDCVWVGATLSKIKTMHISWMTHAQTYTDMHIHIWISYDSPPPFSPEFPNTHIQDNPAPTYLCSHCHSFPESLSLNPFKPSMSCQFKSHPDLLRELNTNTPANIDLHIFQFPYSLFIISATQSSSNPHDLREFAVLCVNLDYELFFFF